MSVAVPITVADPEQRAGRWASVSALASVGVLLAALVVANSATAGAARGPSRLHELTNFHDLPSQQALAATLRGAGLVLGIGAGFYLYWLVRRRGAPANRLVVSTIVVGPVLVAAATAFGFFAMRDVSDAFFAAGPRTAARASDLIDHSSRLHLAGALDIASRIVFAVWVAWTSLYAMRGGLFTSFLGYWGLGAAGALVLLPVGDAMYIGWLASLGFLAFGYWPGGRPAAWAGRGAVQ